jgi:hypothetical protein
VAVGVKVGSGVQVGSGVGGWAVQKTTWEGVAVEVETFEPQRGLQAERKIERRRRTVIPTFRLVE